MGGIMGTINFNDIRPHTSGRWLWLIEQLAPALSESVAKLPRHVSCPVHGGNDGFRLYKNANDTGGGICNTCGAYPDGFALLSWVNGWTLPDTLNAVAVCLGLDNGTSEVKPPAKHQTSSSNPANKPNQDKRKREALRAAWAGLIPLSDDRAEIARNYLVNRGLGDCLNQLPDDLFFHAGLSYWHDGKDYGLHPALVAVVRGKQGEPVTLHRTYLDASGQKANLPTVKKLMSPVLPGSSRGGAIRLFENGTELILAEGIETALALNLALKKPCWACVSAGGLESVQLPNKVKRLIIGADNDENRAGQNAAYELANRLLKDSVRREVKIIIPDEPDTDWLDVFNDEGKAA
jgi:phage/plasmid primase-like uncharacterized protein